MKLNNNQEAFFALVRAGLWTIGVRLSQFGKINFNEVYRLAGEQSVVGLVAAGIEHVLDVKIPQKVALTVAGMTLQLEQRNQAMNECIAWLIERLRREGVYAVIVKGQGIAQCYERPLWRVCGDVDLLLSDTNYEKAKSVLCPSANAVKGEYKSFKHLGMTMSGGFEIELHGTLHSRLSKRVDKVIDDAQKDVLWGGNVRSWQDGNTTIFLPAPDNDVIFIFTHILHHFFIDGIGLRQICDWCRLLWTFRSSIDVRLLAKRLREAKIMSEWRAFAALAVDWLGMPIGAIPFYSSDKKWSEKANRILAFVLDTGNFGHNRQATKSKASSFLRKTKDFSLHALIFPWDSLRFFFHFMVDGIKLVAD